MKTYTVVLRDKTRFTLDAENAAEANAMLHAAGHYDDGPKRVRHLYCEAEALPPPKGTNL